MKGLILDLDQTIIDSSSAERYRKSGNWNKVYSLIPKFEPYPSILETIQELISNDIKVCVVTSSPRQYYEEIASSFEFPDEVLSVCHGETKKHKPDPEPVIKALKQLKLKSKDVFALGDTENDIEAYEEAGIECGLCRWGNPGEKFHYTLEFNSVYDFNTYLFDRLPSWTPVEETTISEYDIECYGFRYYYPRNIKNGLSPNASNFRYFIWDLKESNDNALIYFATILNSIVNKIGWIDGIACVPSSTTDLNHHMSLLIDKATVNTEIMNLGNLIVRKIAVPSASGNKDHRLRTVKYQKSTMAINQKVKVPATVNRILLIDDVYTTGSQMISACELLQEKYPLKEIIAFTFGRTSHDTDNYFSSIPFFPSIEDEIKLLPSKPKKFKKTKDVAEVSCSKAEITKADVRQIVRNVLKRLNESNLFP